MNLLDASEVEAEFTTGGDERREADPLLTPVFRHKERLLKALREARDEIAALRDEVEKLSALEGVREEFKENEDLPNTTNPDDWAKIAGKKGERIVYVKSLVGQVSPTARSVEKVVNTGQYL